MPLVTFLKSDIDYLRNYQYYTEQTEIGLSDVYLRAHERGDIHTINAILNTVNDKQSQLLPVVTKRLLQMLYQRHHKIELTAIHYQVDVPESLIENINEIIRTFGDNEDSRLSNGVYLINHLIRYGDVDIQYFLQIHPILKVK